MRIDWFHIPLLCLLLLLAGCPKPLEPKIAVEHLGPGIFDYAGIRVIHVSTPRAPLELRLVFQGNPLWNNGVKPFQSRLAMATALRSGAGDWSPIEMGAQIDQEKLLMDYKVDDGCAWLRMACLPEQLATSWDIFKEIIMAPLFDEEVLASEQKSVARTYDLVKEEAFFGLGKLVRAKGFGPLGLGSGNGLEPGLELPGIDVIREWYQQKMLGQGRLALVVVGEVDTEAISDLLFRSLSNLPTRGWDGNDPTFTPVPLSKGVFVEKAAGESEAIALHLPLADVKTQQYSSDVFAQASLMVFWDLCKTRVRDLFADDPLLLSRLRFRFEGGSRPGGWMAIDGGRVMPPTELIMSTFRTLYQNPPTAAEIETSRTSLLNQQLRTFQSNRNLADQLARSIGTNQLADLLPRLQAIQIVSDKQILEMGQYALENLAWFYVGVPSRVDRNNLTRLE